MTAGITKGVSLRTGDKQINFSTSEGLRAMVRYEETPEGYKVYASGDATYGLVAFWAYQSLKEGEPPEIVEFGRPSDSL